MSSNAFPPVEFRRWAACRARLRVPRLPSPARAESSAARRPTPLLRLLTPPLLYFFRHPPKHTTEIVVEWNNPTTEKTGCIDQFR
jgi:hypothetical protein